MSDEKSDGTTALCVVGVLVAASLFTSFGYSWGSHNEKEDAHQAVFDEQVAKHGCKLQKVWVDGKEVEGKTCILPDGTILQRGE